MSTKHIKIISCGNNYLQVIRSIRQITGLGLKDAMDLADNLPIDLFATDQQITDLKNAGATVAEVPTTASRYAPSTTRTVTTSSNYSTKTVSSTNNNASSMPQRSFNTQQSPATKRSLPPNTYLGMSGKQYQLSSKLGSGGEGDIYSVSGDSSKVAKLYHADRVSRELEEKLRYMVNKPPRTEVLSQVAWPMDVLYDGSNKFIGFVMPKLTIDADLGEIYAYPPKGAAVMPYNYKLIIAMNICSVIYAVHQAGYIFGDFNPKNIGINLKTGAVAFMDTDSYHIVLDERANKAYRCKVCLNGYVAPELQKQCEPYGQDAYEKAPLPTFTYETDNFALAIHIFKLLMNGYTPFNGINETETVSTASPGVGNLAIKRDNYCFKPHNKPQAVAVPPLDALPDDIATLFNKAFIDGRKNPKERPNALAWRKALENYERVLKKCSNNPNHLFKNSLRTCPWCEADERYKQQFQRTSAPSQRAFPAPVSVPTAPPPLAPPSTTQTTATNTVTPTQTIAQSSGVSWKNKKRSTLNTADYVITYIFIVISGAISLWYSSLDPVVIALFAVFTITMSVGMFTNEYNPDNWFHWNNLFSIIIFAFVIYTKDTAQDWTGGFGALMMKILFFILPAGIGFCQVLIPYCLHNGEVNFFHIFFMVMIWLSRLLKDAFAHYIDYKIVVYVIFAIIAAYSIYTMVSSIKKSRYLLIMMPVVYIMGGISLFNILSTL